MKQQIEDLKQKQKVVLERLIGFEVNEEDARVRRENKCRSERERNRVRREHETARKLSQRRISSLVKEVLDGGSKSKNAAACVRPSRKSVSIEIIREAAKREKIAIRKSKRALRNRSRSSEDRVHKLMSARRRLLNEYQSIIRAERQAGRCTIRSSLLSARSTSSSKKSYVVDSDAMSVMSLETLPRSRVVRKEGWNPPPPLDFSRLNLK
jgi:hypothetical protein